MDSTSELNSDRSAMDQDILGLLRSFHSFERREKEHAISVLQSLDRKPTAESLLRVLGNGDVELRCDAAEALMWIDPKQGTEIVLSLLSDLDATVRWNACGLLYDFGDHRATPRLVEVLRDDAESDVRLIAAHALGRVGDLSAVPFLRHAARVDTGQDYEGRRVSEAAQEAIESIQRRHM
jgi:HEAT repeat protein